MTVAGPATAEDVADWVRGLDLPGLVDMHVHFLPDSVMRKVWAYFDMAEQYYGVPWPVHYRTDEQQRLATLRSFGVSRFAPLVYPHKPDMAEWLNSWVAEFADREPDAVRTATMYPEASAARYVDDALRAGARCFKVHVQVGDFDPRDERLDTAWGALEAAGVPVVVHCGHGPLRGNYTGLDVFEGVLARHPRLVAVLAHAGMPDYDHALRLVGDYPRVYLDTTMVGVDFTERLAPLPADWAPRLAAVPDRVVFGTDFPNIPYSYDQQLRAVASWAASDESLGLPFLRSVLYDTPAKLLGI